MNLDDYTTLDPEGEFSDCTIECGGQVFKVHKVFVCTQSPVFRAALVGGFKEGTTSTYKIDGFDVDIAKRMIRFLYGDKDVWPKLSEQTPAPDSAGANAESDKATEDTADPKTLHVTTLIKMCNIAEYFGITKMQEAGRAEINDFFDSPANWCAVVFNKAAKLVVSESGDKDLHAIFARVASQHVADYKAFDMTTLIALDDFMHSFMYCVDKQLATLKKSNEQLERHANKVIDIAKSGRDCWNCNRKMGNMVISQDDKTLNYRVRCRTCNKDMLA